MVFASKSSPQGRRYSVTPFIIYISLIAVELMSSIDLLLFVHEAVDFTGVIDYSTISDSIR